MGRVEPKDQAKNAAVILDAGPFEIDGETASDIKK